MPSKKYRTPIIQERVYHIFNRGINHQVVFHSAADKEWFLCRFKHYLRKYAEVHSYCVLDNHYHFLIRVKCDPKADSNFSRQFGNLILSYTHYYNRKYNHSGPIFHRCFKRLMVLDEVYFLMLFWYIHNNPIRHGVSEDIYQYPFSSLTAIAHGNEFMVKSKLITDSFGSIQSFLEFHQKSHSENRIGDYVME